MIFMPPVHFSILTVQRGTIMQFMPGAAPGIMVVMPAGMLPVIPIDPIAELTMVLISVCPPSAPPQVLPTPGENNSRRRNPHAGMIKLRARESIDKQFFLDSVANYLSNENQEKTRHGSLRGIHYGLATVPGFFWGRPERCRFRENSSGNSANDACASASCSLPIC